MRPSQSQLMPAGGHLLESETRSDMRRSQEQQAPAHQVESQDKSEM